MLNDSGEILCLLNELSLIVVSRTNIGSKEAAVGANGNLLWGEGSYGLRTASPQLGAIIRACSRSHASPLSVSRALLLPTMREVSKLHEHEEML